MPRPDPQALLPAPLLDAAIDWIVRLESGRASAADCAVWRAASAQHEQVWQQLHAIDEDFRATPAVPGRLLLDVLDAAAREQPAQPGRRRALKVLALGGVGIGSVVLARQLPWQRYAADYRTAPGERHSFELADGTQLLLNSDSAADLRFTPQQRLIVLHRGEILIRTGADAGAPTRRPFRVETAAARFEAIGTRFSVREQAGVALLHVSDGRVAAQGKTGGAQLLIDAGQAAQVTAAAAQTMDAGNGGLDPTAWTDGVLVARQVRLADFAAELARHTGGWLSCDPQLAELRVSGVFQLDDPQQILQTLSRSLPLRVERRLHWWVRLLPA